PGDRASPRRLLATSAGSQTGAFGTHDWLLLATCALVWGSSFYFISVGLDHFSPGVVTFGRIAFGAAALWSLPATRRTKIDAADRARVALLGVCWMAFPLTMYSVAEQWIDSSVAGMITAATPIWTALVAAALLRALPGRALRAGLVVGLVGVGVLSWPSIQGADASLAGVVLVVLATASYGIASNVAVPLQQRYGGLPVLARAQLVALVLTAPYAAIGAGDSRFALGSFLAVLALGVLGTGVAFVAGATLMGRVGATRGSVLTYLMPVVSITLGVSFLDERFAAYEGIGVVLVLVGAFLASRADRPEPVIPVGD
ncbi:MAG TPA: DMT family transporter, partial [Acidimicrobiia bacterium]|nr:DMT family transporter [Acidimicrobiia bacterium]